METDDERGSVCVTCRDASGVDEVVVFTHATDPLQVVECGRCGSILDIGGHRW